jgi:hypothetical protein
LRSYLLTILVLLGFAASVNAGQSTKEQPKTGTIIVYRKWAFTGGGRSLPFSVDGKFICKLRNGYYYSLELSVGDHIFTHDPGFGITWGHDPQTVHVIPGQTIYFCNFMNMVTYVWEVAEDQAGAKESVSRLKAQN